MNLKGGQKECVVLYLCVLVYLVNRISRCEERYSLGVNVRSQTARLGT